MADGVASLPVGVVVLHMQSVLGDGLMLLHHKLPIRVPHHALEHPTPEHAEVRGARRSGKVDAQLLAALVPCIAPRQVVQGGQGLAPPTPALADGHGHSSQQAHGEQTRLNVVPQLVQGEQAPPLLRLQLGREQQVVLEEGPHGGGQCLVGHALLKGAHVLNEGGDSGVVGGKWEESAQQGQQGKVQCRVQLK